VTHQEKVHIFLCITHWSQAFHFAALDHRVQDGADCAGVRIGIPAEFLETNQTMDFQPFPDPLLQMPLGQIFPKYEPFHGTPPSLTLERRLQIQL